MRPVPTPDPGPAPLPAITLGDAEGDDHDGAAELSLVKPIGEGGMGVVWLARQGSLDREVALKRVKPGAPRSAADALLREARFLGRLEHPHVVPVHALGADASGSPVLVMKRIEGVAWRTVIADPAHPWWTGDGAPDRLVRHVEILVEVCKAVHFAHGRGVLHRDLKPDNVMLGAYGEIYVLDWGIATRLDAPDRRVVVGTPAYLAPELLDRELPIGPFTDVYALGACLHEVLTGQPRHAGADVQAVLAAAHASAPYEYGEAVPSELASITNRACARAPADRFGDAQALQRALALWLRHRGAAALSHAAAERLSELRTLLASASSAADRARVDELAVECRFGFKQALADWPESPVAREGLRELLGVLVRDAVTRGDFDGAEALAHQLDAEGGDAASLRSAIALARRERDLAEERARERDLRSGSRVRTAFTLGVTLLFLSVLVGIWAFDGGADFDAKTGFFLLVVLNIPVWVGMLVTRRYVADNAVNRGVAAVTLACTIFPIFNRAVAWRFGTDVPAMLAGDLVIFATGTALLGPLVAPRMVLGSVFFVLGALGVMAWPEHAIGAFSLGAVAGLTWCGGITWWTWGRDQA